MGTAKKLNLGVLAHHANYDSFEEGLIAALAILETKTRVVQHLIFAGRGQALNMDAWFARRSEDRERWVDAWSYRRLDWRETTGKQFNVEFVKSATGGLLIVGPLPKPSVKASGKVTRADEEWTARAFLDGKGRVFQFTDGKLAEVEAYSQLVFG